MEQYNKVMLRKIKRTHPAHAGIQYITTQEIREEVRPFVFFDAATMQRRDDGLFIGQHPHS